ncbi:nitric oxide synthase-like protein [Ixodes scapularis]|uniref:nitric oxide synthase-like protein n=1 Tax=Ixodes scapularis TaxID=6945 RepID=UPI001A9D68F3|nr:nitric oxide synthase-like protein [Ixodes scapularis]
MSRPVSLVKRRQGGLGLVLGPQGSSPRPGCSPLGSPARGRRGSSSCDGAAGPRAVVQSLVPGGEADRTGLIRPGDVVLRVNGTCVTGFEHGNCLLGQLPDDASVTLELACNGALDGADASSGAGSSPASSTGDCDNSAKRPLIVRNVETGKMLVDSLHKMARNPLPCSNTICQGSLMCGPVRRNGKEPRPTDDVLQHAKEFLDQFYTSIKRFHSKAHEKRWSEVERQVQQRGTYDLTETELVFGAKLAWRNSARCIGRIQWSKLQVFDARHCYTARDMYEAICAHLKYSTNKGNIRSAITIFPPRTDGHHDYRVWNAQLIQFAGHKQPDGSVVGDPASVELTEICKKLGWKPKGTRFEALPLVLSANGEDPEWFEIPEDLIMRVKITHPKYESVGEMGLEWYAVPAVSGMMLDLGGVEFTACPFNGWYMVTEIAVRDFCDVQRFNLAEEVASRIGLDTKTNSNLWRDRAVIELTLAVLYSFQKANVTIVDHHTASEQFMKHMENENRLRGGCPGDWVWIVPPLSGSLTPVFHQEMLYYHLKPNYEYQMPAWKTHVWQKKVDDQRRYSRKFRFKDIASAVKFTSAMYGKALAKRVKAKILYATETGKSETYAKVLCDIFLHAFNATVECMEDYDFVNLEFEPLLLVISSTFGNGEPPENGEVFARNLQVMKSCSPFGPEGTTPRTTSMSFVRKNSVNASENDTGSPPPAHETSDLGPLSNVRFAVFGLGSSAYPNFCAYGKYVDKILADLGGERICKLTTGDELRGQEQSFRQWAKSVFEQACDVFCVGDGIGPIEMTPSMEENIAWSPDKVRLDRKATDKNPVLGFGLSKGSSRRVVISRLVSRKVLQWDPEDDKKTIMVVLESSNESELKYAPGDHIGIYAVNRDDIVNGIVERIAPGSADPDTVYRVQYREIVQNPITGEQKETWQDNTRMPPCSLRVALSRYMDITTPASQELLKYLAAMASDPRQQETLQTLATNLEKYEDWKAHKFPHLLDLLEEFPSVRPTAELLLCMLPLIQPRFYSISSAPEAYPGQIHLTVAVVTYTTENGSGKKHYGVCSSFLDTLNPGEEMACFVRIAPNFHLPERKNVPVVLVGPGTGIAPYRSFWQRRYCSMQGVYQEGQPFYEGPMTLYFGCRTSDSQLYAEEVQTMKDVGALENVFLAFSRVPGKQKHYVQDRLHEKAPELYRQLVKECGHLYVCGDVIMADGVNKAVREILRDQGKITEEKAEALMDKLREENRIHEDIFGVTLRTEEATRKSREDAKRRSTSK